MRAGGKKVGSRCGEAINGTANERTENKKIINRSQSYTELAQSFTERKQMALRAMRCINAPVICAKRPEFYSVKLCCNSVQLCDRLIICLIACGDGRAVQRSIRPAIEVESGMQHL